MKVNFLSRSIELSASELRKASDPGSHEYSELLRLMSDLPSFEVTVKRSVRHVCANRGLTYEYMERYIAEHAPERMGDFLLVRKACGYPTTTKWFRNEFQGEDAMVDLCTTFSTAA